MEFTAPQEASVVMVAKRAELKIPKRTSLPSMLPAAASTPKACRRGLPADSAHQQIDPAQEDGGHGAPDRPPVALVFHHAPEVIGQAAGNQENGEHLDKVGEAASGSHTDARRWHS